MKKLVTAALAVVMVISLAACGGKKSPNTVFSKDDLVEKKIGVQLGTTGDIFATGLEEDGSKCTVERYNKGNDAVMSLKQGKLDCVMIDEQPAKAYISGNSDLMILDEPYDLEEYAMCISKDNTQLKEKINQALAEIKEDGTLDNIIKNYIGDDTKGKTPYESPSDVDRSNGTITMGTNADFPPYEFYEGQKVVGIDADMMQAIADRLGMELKIEDMKFDAIITAVQTGKADVGASGMTMTEERLKNIDFTDTYATAKQVLIVRK